MSEPYEQDGYGSEDPGQYQQYPQENGYGENGYGSEDPGQYQQNGYEDPASSYVPGYTETSSSVPDELQGSSAEDTQSNDWGW